MSDRDRNCPCCKHTYCNLLYTTATQQMIVCCDRCKMVYATNSPCIDYTNHSIYASSTYDAQTAHYCSIVANTMKSGINIRASVLDVGCATGGLMEAFISAGFTDVTGISLSQAEVDFCTAKKLNAHVWPPEQQDDPWFPEQYDIVTVSHVLEHVPDVQEFLHNLKQWVKPRGSVYIEVPNAMKYHQYFTSICQGFNSEHINHFDLKHLVHSCIGMEVYETGSYESMTEGKRLYPVIWILAHPHASELEYAINAYADELTAQLAVMKAHLHKELEGVKSLAIWGMGQTTRILLPSGLIPADVKIRWATDSNTVYHGQAFADAVVSSPQQFTPPEPVPILVCSQLSQAAVLRQIKELGLTNRIITLEESK